jgi:hypothetical protein
VGGVTLCCHFFDEADIELDIDPRDVVDDTKAEAVLTFMAEMGTALSREVRLTPESREVRLTPENCPEIAIFSYDPVAGQVRYVPAAGRI